MIFTRQKKFIPKLKHRNYQLPNSIYHKIKMFTLTKLAWTMARNMASLIMEANAISFIQFVAGA